MLVKRLCVLLLLALTFALTACPTHTSIADLTRDPSKYAGKDITISGHVSDSFGALGSGVFQIDDGSGTLWVYSGSYGVPANGSKVAVTGRIQQGFSFGGRTFANILRETQPRN